MDGPETCGSLVSLVSWVKASRCQGDYVRWDGGKQSGRHVGGWTSYMKEMNQGAQNIYRTSHRMIRNIVVWKQAVSTSCEMKSYVIWHLFFFKGLPSVRPALQYKCYNMYIFSYVQYFMHVGALTMHCRCNWTQVFEFTGHSLMSDSRWAAQWSVF